MLRVDRKEGKNTWACMEWAEERGTNNGKVYGGRQSFYASTKGIRSKRG